MLKTLIFFALTLTVSYAIILPTNDRAYAPPTVSLHHLSKEQLIALIISIPSCSAAVIKVITVVPAPPKVVVPPKVIPVPPKVVPVHPKVITIAHPRPVVITPGVIPIGVTPVTPVVPPTPTTTTVTNTATGGAGGAGGSGNAVGIVAIGGNGAPGGAGGAASIS